MMMGVQPGHDARTARTADRGRVEELVECDATLGQSVERRHHPVPVEPFVVGHDQDHVGAVRRHGPTLRPHQAARGHEGEQDDADTHR